MSDASGSYENAVLRRTAVALVCAKVAVVPLLFDPASYQAFVQPKVLFSYAVDLVLLGILTSLALSYRRSLANWSPLQIPVIVFVVAYVLATAFAMDLRVAVFGTNDRALGLLTVLDSTLLYAAIVLVFRTHRDVLWLGTAAIGSMAVVIVYEVVQVVGLDPISWTRSSSEALFSTLGNRGVLAQYLGTTSMAVLGFALASRGWPQGRAAAAAVGLLGLAGTITSGARAAVIGLAAGAATLGILLTMAETDPRKRALRALAGGTIGAFVLLAAALTPVGQRFAAFVQDPASLMRAGVGDADLSAAARVDLYRVALAEARDRPLLGVGPDNFAVAFAEHRTAESTRLYGSGVSQTSTHSWLAKTVTDAGLIGLAAFLAVVTASVWLTLRRPEPWRIAALTGMATFLGTGLVSVSHVATDWLPWLFLGVIAAPIGVSATAAPELPRRPKGRAAARRARSAPRQPAQVIGGVAIAVGVVLALASIKDPLEASRQAQVARAANAGDARARQLGLAAAQRSVSLEPSRADYWNELALIQYRQDDMRGAVRSWERASDLAPFNSVYLANLSLAQLRLGLRGEQPLRERALATARSLASRDPYVPEVQYSLALAAAGNGHPEETIEAAESWLRLGATPEPGIAQAAGEAYLALERPVEAERWARLVLTTDQTGPSSLRLLLARALVAQRRTEEAVRELDVLLAAEPTYKPAIDLRADLMKSRR